MPNLLYLYLKQVRSVNLFFIICHTFKQQLEGKLLVKLATLCVIFTLSD